MTALPSPPLSGRMLLVLSLTAAGSLHAAPKLDFNRDVRPVLAQHCFKCHGMDDHGRKGGLRLDLREAALGKGKSGEHAIVPGNADQSEVMVRVLSTDPDEVMPPPSTKTVLPDSAKAILKAWVEQGAEYQPHWAFTPPAPQPPPVAGIHPVDAFIQDRIAKEGLQPSPAADKHTLIRRVSLDLTGLPPTPAESDAFAQDSAPDAYERLVDRLLSSPAYGERWARRWLDLARYADTNGYEKDRPRSIWPYRDWVVQALNADMPYDQFSIKQLAGDMLPNATPEDLIATGFHRNTMLNEEGGIDPLEFRFHAMTDRVSVTGTTWMGLTLNCTQCHTHKYDPILHTDYYSVMALLNNASEPTYYIPTPQISEQFRERDARIAQLEAALPAQFPGGAETLKARFGQWVQEALPSAATWKILKPAAVQTNLPHLEPQPDGFLLGSGDVTKSDTYELTFRQPLKNVRAIRLEVASHSSLPNDGPGLTAYEGPLGGFFLSELQALQNGAPLAFAAAKATNDVQDPPQDPTPAPTPPTEPEKTPPPAAPKPTKKVADKKANAASALDGDMSSGWMVNGGFGVRHTAVFFFKEPVDLTQGITLRMLFEKHYACSLGHFRISAATTENATLTGLPADIEELLASGKTEPQGALLTHFLETAPEMKQAAAPLLAQRRKVPRGQATLVMQERPASHPRPTHRHHRGEYLQPKEEVQPAVPSFLPPLPKDAPANRRTFARWLFAPENPLTARVTVNRHWQAFFGRGLVQSLEDFGYQSDPPSHPELLDWLALELVREKWSLKKLHRLIVTSSTYRQSSKVTPELAQKDPKNILLARGSRFRLDAEIIRDSALKAAGVLSSKMGGPGVYPPQPTSVTTEGTYGKIEWKTSQGEDRYRRSLYTFTKRTAPFAMATTFDAPTGEACLAKREVSNSPLQALTLLNDTMFVEAAGAMAKAVMTEAQSDTDRLQNLFRRCVTRPAAPEELALLQSFLEKQRALPLEGEVLWSSVARAALNFDETITHP
jgi:hypothetical protein